MLAVEGTIILTLLIRAYLVQDFWGKVNDIMETLSHVLRTEVVSRTHTPTGVAIDESEKEAQGNWFMHLR